jgi:hypothetical protein
MQEHDTSPTTPEKPDVEARDPLRASRHERVDDYLDHALKASHPLEANLGVVHSDLMWFAGTLNDTLSGYRREAAETLLAKEEFFPTLEMYLKVSKQIDRFAQLLLKVQKLESAS